MRHFAGDVCYVGSGFCDKNNDTLHTDFADALLFTVAHLEKPAVELWLAFPGALVAAALQARAGFLRGHGVEVLTLCGMSKALRCCTAGGIISGCTVHSCSRPIL